MVSSEPRLWRAGSPPLTQVALGGPFPLLPGHQIVTLHQRYTSAARSHTILHKADMDAQVQKQGRRGAHCLILRV
jgi:hypothetical protein